MEQVTDGPAIRSVEQLRELDGKRRCKLIERLQRGVPSPHLDARNVAAVEVRLLGEALLGPSPRVPQFSDSTTDPYRCGFSMATATHLAMVREIPGRGSRLIVTIDLS